jgi:hypothetical protein
MISDECTRCGEQNQYCHGHTPVLPNPSLELDLPNLESQCSAPIPADGVVTV